MQLKISHRLEKKKKETLSLLVFNFKMFFVQYTISANL